MKYNLRSLMKFSIRDLLLVTVIVALAVGWWVDRSRLAGLLKKEREWNDAMKVPDWPDLPNYPASVPNPPKE